MEGEASLMESGGPGTERPSSPDSIGGRNSPSGGTRRSASPDSVVGRSSPSSAGVEQHPTEPTRQQSRASSILAQAVRVTVNMLTPRITPISSKAVLHKPLDLPPPPATRMPVTSSDLEAQPLLAQHREEVAGQQQQRQQGSQQGVERGEQQRQQQEQQQEQQKETAHVLRRKLKAKGSPGRSSKRRSSITPADVSVKPAAEASFKRQASSAKLVVEASFKGGSSSNSPGNGKSAQEPLDPYVVEVFRKADFDGGGRLSLSELVVALGMLGMKSSPEAVSKTLQRFDTSGKHELDVNDFAKLVATLEADKVRAAFGMYDQDGSGDIDAKELRGALKELGINFGTISGIDELIRSYVNDEDEDASLQLDEFHKLYLDLKRFQHAGSSDLTSFLAAKEAEKKEEEYDDDGRPLPNSAIGWIIFALLAVATVLFEFVLDALSGGSCMILLPAGFSLLWWLNDVVTSFVREKLYELEELGAAPPPPPAHPDLASVAINNLFAYAEEHPGTYLFLNYGITTAIAVFFLFLKDMQVMLSRVTDEQVTLQTKGESASWFAAASSLLRQWWRAYLVRRAQQGSGEASPASGYDLEAGSPSLDAEGGEDVAMNLADLKRELRLVTDDLETLELRCRVLGKPNTEAAVEARARRAELQARREELCTIVEAASSEDAHKQAVAQKVKTKKETLMTRVMKSTAVKIMMNALNGVMSVSIYFADLISDLQVIELLYNTDNMLWMVLSVFILVAQFVVCWVRVIPYMGSTFGDDSAIYRGWLFIGFPWGLIALDLLMFLEPFGLISVLPMPDWLRQFIPAYKATRIIAEVAIESVPQCVLQSYIYLIVILNSKAGTATPSQLAMLEFASLLPKSILISLLSTLKTWIELVHGARQAGLSVAAKAMQLWQVGAGLPLDALKKGAIVTWRCPYELGSEEIPPVLDALGKNSSLAHLDLSRSGILFGSPDASGYALVEKLNKTAAALSSVGSFIISPASNFPIPLGSLRADSDSALVAVRSTRFFTKDGPWLDEVLFIGELLRSNLGVNITDPEKAAMEVAATLLIGARHKKVKRDAWEEKLTDLLIQGTLRRGHLVALVAAETLREVGFAAAELLAASFSLSTLRRGGFKAAEMRSIGLKSGELGKAGFTPAELKTGGFSAKEMKSAGYSPADMKSGGFTVKQLKMVGFGAAELKENGISAKELREGTFTAKDVRPLEYSVDTLRQAGFPAKELNLVGYTLAELKEGNYSGSECRVAGFGATDMRAARFTASEMKAAGASPSELRIAGYTTNEMRAAGFSAKKVRSAGYTAVEACDALWSVEVLKEAGYDAQQLREAQRSAAELNAVGFSLKELREAGYSTQELQDVGFGAEELRAAGTSLSDLTSAGATVKDLKAAGISAIGLRAEGVPLEDMKEAGYSLKELRSAGYSTTQLRAVGYEAHELTAAGYNVAELKDGGYTTIEELTMAGCVVRDLKEGGFLAGALRKGGFSAEDLTAGGYSCKELRDGGYPALELRNADHPAADLRKAGFHVRALRAAKFTCAELANEAGCSVKELVGAGFSAIELRSVGFSARQLRGAGIKIEDMRRAEYTAMQLRDAKFTVKEMRSVGFSAVQLEALGCVASELRQGGFSAEEMAQADFPLYELRACGFTCADLKRIGYSADELKQVGANAKELAEGGFDVEDLRVVGFSAQQLKGVGFNATQLRAGGFTAKALELVNFSAGQLKAAGYRARDIRDCGLKASTVFDMAELKADGFSLKELKDEKFLLKELKEVFSVEELKNVLFTPQELISVGFTMKDLRKPGRFAVSELKKAGYSAPDIKKGGYTVSELRNGGFTCHDLREDKLCTMEELREGGFTVDQLKLAGFTAKDMRLGKYEIAALIANGFTLTELRDGGFEVADMRRANVDTATLLGFGYSLEEIKRGGFRAGDLLAAGVSLEQISEAGYSVAEMKRAGITAQQFRDVLHASAGSLHSVGFTCAELYAVGYTSIELCAGDYTVKQLRSVGLSAGELHEAGMAAEALEDAGYTCNELYLGHYKASEMTNLSYTAQEFRVAGFPAADLKAIGWTAHELRDGGYELAVLRKLKFPPYQMKSLV